MRAHVRVVPQAQYEKFLASAGGGPGGQTDGKTVFLNAGCGACHAFTPAGSSAEVGPRLDAVDPEGAPLEDFIRESIVDPNAKVTSGYQPDVMPGTFESTLTGKQLDALVQYLVEGQKR
jgi:mono/diheme cytochrome c family protein